jgi:F-type H+-transporting ATPase subunit a
MWLNVHTLNKLFLGPAHTLAFNSHESPLGWGIYFFSGITFLVVAIFIVIARRGLKERIPRNLFAQWAEHIYHFMEGLCLSVIGSHGRKYMPFLMALWLYIFTANIVGLILPHTPSADWSLNLGLSIVTILYVQYEGIRAHGFWGHVRHFAGPKLPILMALFMTPLIFGIEIVSETMKIVTLSLRLFLNRSSGHVVVTTLHNLSLEGRIPWGGLLLPIELLACVLQAYIFVMLTSVYLALVTGPSEEEESYSPGLDEANVMHASTL